MKKSPSHAGASICVHPEPTVHATAQRRSRGGQRPDTRMAGSASERHPEEEEQSCEKRWPVPHRLAALMGARDARELIVERQLDLRWRASVSSHVERGEEHCAFRVLFSLEHEEV